MNEEDSSQLLFDNLKKILELQSQVSELRRQILKIDPTFFDPKNPKKYLEMKQLIENKQ